MNLWCWQWWLAVVNIHKNFIKYSFVFHYRVKLQYWLDVRPGNTHTSVSAPEIIHRIFSQMRKTKKYKRMKKYVRADSGFCNTAFFNSCFVKEIKFVTSMRANMFHPLLQNVRRWKEVKKTGRDNIKFYDGRDCEIGQASYKSA